MIDQATPSTSNQVSSSSLSLGLRRYVNQPRLADDEVPFNQMLRWLLLHVPLLLIFRVAPFVATAHSLVVLLLGLHFLTRDKQPTRVAWVIGYLAGAEILWRGVNGSLISEYGKYATILLCILMIFKYRLIGRATLWPLLFIGLLVPAIFIAPRFDREAISFQLGGLVAMGIASLVFSALEFKKGDLQRFFLSVLAPTVASGFLVFSMLVTQDIAFYGNGENELTTGGIGANQITSALSLGATIAFFYIFLAGNDRRIRYLMILLVLGLLGLSVLTFSRSGLWNAAGALAVGLLFLVRDRRRILNILSVIVIFGLLVYFVIFPFFNDLTGGALLVRFSDFDSTGRDILLQIDYQVFLDNPVLGVGVGQSLFYHVPFFGYLKPTHTEYGRLLAEHGSLGVAAMALLALVTLARIVARRPPISKAISVAFTTWALLYLAHSATRMVAPSFAFGLAAARFLPEEEKEELVD